MTRKKSIERAKQRHIAKLQGLRGLERGDNFVFVCWGDVTELKLWRR